MASVAGIQAVPVISTVRWFVNDRRRDISKSQPGAIMCKRPSFVVSLCVLVLFRIWKALAVAVNSSSFPNCRDYLAATPFHSH